MHFVFERGSVPLSESQILRIDAETEFTTTASPPCDHNGIQLQPTATGDVHTEPR